MESFTNPHTFSLPCSCQTRQLKSSSFISKLYTTFWPVLLTLFKSASTVCCDYREQMLWCCPLGLGRRWGQTVGSYLWSGAYEQRLSLQILTTVMKVHSFFESGTVSYWPNVTPCRPHTAHLTLPLTASSHGPPAGLPHRAASGHPGHAPHRHAGEGESRC